jgi:hypothetical protein
MTDLKKTLYFDAHDNIKKAQSRQEKDYNKKKGLTKVHVFPPQQFLL